MNRKALLMGLSGMLLSACSTGSLFKSSLESPVAYVLSVRGGDAAAPSGAGIPVDLSILKPRMRPGLDTDRIAARYPDRRLDFYAGSKWSGSLDDVLQDLTVQMFHQRSNLRSVSSESTRFTSGYWLEIEVEDFQAEYPAGGGAPVIRVRMIGRLGRASDHAGIGNYDAKVTQAATEDRMGPIIDAYEQAANTALAQIIDQTSATLASTPPAT